MTTEELKVLLLEDNEGDAFLIKFYLEESTTPSFKVSHATNLQGALDFLSKEKFDLILSDMNLPDSFGMDTIKTMLSKYPGNLIIVLTGLTDEYVGLQTVRFGAQDFLVKGKFDGKVLVSSILFAFERFKLNKEIDHVSKELDAENWRLDSIQRLLKVGYSEIDPRTQTIYRSRFTIEMMDYNPKKQNGKMEDFGENIHPDDLNRIMAKLAEVMVSKTSGEEIFRHSKNGKIYRVLYEYRNEKICCILQESK
ncbi:MAG: response regulator [Bacteroidetes bacterium]|nr:response regulator [Bacteroidota bacterium]